MTRYGERFFTSLGFDAAAADVLGAVAVREAARPRGRLPRQRVEHQQRRRPAHQDVHRPDRRRTSRTIHHELGHDFYARAYKPQPMIFRDSANDGFHEAIGDTIALSVTPEYLVKVGLLDKAPDASGDIPLLLRDALERLAFLPFGLVVDQWRWQVFSGQVTPDQLQRGVVGAARAVSGRRAAVAARRGVLRSGRQVPRPGEHAVRAVLPRRRAAVPVPPRAGEGGRLHDAAAPLLDLRQRRGGRAAEDDAGDGRVAAVARRARSAHRPAADGRHRDGRLLRAAQGVARRAEQRPNRRLVMMNELAARLKTGPALNECCCRSWSAAARPRSAAP